MATIYHNFQIKGKAGKVFKAISKPQNIEKWWSVSASGKASFGEIYSFYFGPDFKWDGRVTKFIKDESIEWLMTFADDDWTDTTISFELSQDGDVVNVAFVHDGWAETNDHFKISSYCWGQYLRTLKRFVEIGEVVPYEDRGGS